MKMLTIAACLAAITLGACRREVPSDGGYVPMKLGAPPQADTANR